MITARPWGRADLQGFADRPVHLCEAAVSQKSSISR
jgi:hypothetical protein